MTTKEAILYNHMHNCSNCLYKMFFKSKFAAFILKLVMVKVIVDMLCQNPSNLKSKDPLRDPTISAMFPRCTATDTCWRRNW